MTEDFKYHISEVYRSEDGHVFVEKVDEKQMFENLNLATRPEGVRLFLTEDRSGEQQIIHSSLVVEKLLGILPLPMFERRLAKATEKMVALALEIEFKEMDNA